MGLAAPWTLPARLAARTIVVLNASAQTSAQARRFRLRALFTIVVVSLLLGVGRGLHALFEFLDVFGRQLRTINLDREFVKLRREWEGHLVISLVHAGKCVRADIEGFVELQDDRDGMFHLLSDYFL